MQQQQVYPGDPYNESYEELESQFQCLKENLRRAQAQDCTHCRSHTKDVWAQIVVFVQYNPDWKERWQRHNPFPDKPLL